jgi:hypothetical protein
VCRKLSGQRFCTRCNFLFVRRNGVLTPCCAKSFPEKNNFENVFDGSVMPVLNGKNSQQWQALQFNNKTPGFYEKMLND